MNEVRRFPLPKFVLFDLTRSKVFRSEERLGDARASEVV